MTIGSDWLLPKQLLPGGQAGGAGSEMAAFQQVIPLIYQFAGFYSLRSRPREKGL